jgi:hypothetical protein
MLTNNTTHSPYYGEQIVYLCKIDAISFRMKKPTKKFQTSTLLGDNLTKLMLLAVFAN